MDAKKEIIVNAIENRLLLEVRYKFLNRRVAPHMLYITEAGTMELLCFQVGGVSSSGKIPGWRILRVSLISDPVCTEIAFPSRADGYAPDKIKTRKILARL